MPPYAPLGAGEDFGMPSVSPIYGFIYPHVSVLCIFVHIHDTNKVMNQLQSVEIHQYLVSDQLSRFDTYSGLRPQLIHCKLVFHFAIVLRNRLTSVFIWIARRYEHPLLLKRKALASVLSSQN